eukprot:797757_1
MDVSPILTPEDNHGSSIEVLFIMMCCIATIFCASTLSLIIVVFCCFHKNQHNKETLLNNVAVSGDSKYTCTSHHNDTQRAPSTPSMLQTPYHNDPTTQDLMHQLQTLQTMLQPQLCPNMCQQPHDSFHNSRSASVGVSMDMLPMHRMLSNESQKDMNHQRRYSSGSPWNQHIQHQLQKQYAYSSNREPDVGLSAPGSTSKQQAPVQVDTIQFMEFLEYQRRQALQQSRQYQSNHIQNQRGKSSSDPAKMQRERVELKVNCDALRSGSSERLFDPVAIESKTLGNDIKPSAKVKRLRRHSRKLNAPTNYRLGEDSEFSYSAPLPVSNPPSDDDVAKR